MRIRLTGVVDADRKVASVKAIRSVTGLGLRESLNVYNTVLDCLAAPPTITTPHDMSHEWVKDQLGPYFYYEEFATVSYEVDHLDTARTVHKALSLMPHHLKVSDVLDVLDAVL